MGKFPYRLEGVSSQDEYQQTQDGIQLREHGQHHGGTESVVTSTYGTNTIGTYLGLTYCREQGYKTQSQSYAKDGTCSRHLDTRHHLAVEHEEAHESVQALR